MNNLSTKIFTTIVFIMIIVTSTISYAANNTYSALITLTSNSKINKGDTVTISVNLANIVAGDGIDAITANLNYDTNVFEILTTENFRSTTNWITTFTKSTGKITSLKNTKVKNSETVFTITLRAKSTIDVASTVVRLEDIVVSGGIVANGGTGDIIVPNASVTLQASEGVKIISSAPTPTLAPTKNTNTLPKTGTENYAYITVIVMLAILLIQIIGYRMNKR